MAETRTTEVPVAAVGSTTRSASEITIIASPAAVAEVVPARTLMAAVATAFLVIIIGSAVAEHLKAGSRKARVAAGIAVAVIGIQGLTEIYEEVMAWSVVGLLVATGRVEIDRL